MEFEKMHSPSWEEIRKHIETSQAVFVFLGRNVTSSTFTRNWIAFEIGLSCSFDKDIWVFEKNTSRVNFPIPYVTDYMPYDDLKSKEVFGYIRNIIEGYGENGKARKPPLVEYEPPNTKLIPPPKGKVVKCRSCKSSFNFHSIEKMKLFSSQTFLCPLCRKEVSI